MNKNKTILKMNCNSKNRSKIKDRYNRYFFMRIEIVWLNNNGITELADGAINTCSFTRLIDETEELSVLC